jgi:hypothetical protein
MEAFMTKYGLSISIILAGGIVGGMANCIMVENGFTSPRTFTSQKGIKTWNPGFLTNLFFGVIASFLTWAFGASELDPLRQAGICLLAGIGGSNVIQSFLQKEKMQVVETKSKEYLNMLKDEVRNREEDNEPEE